MPATSKYEIEAIYDAATRLRDDVNYILEVLEGAIKAHPGTTVEVETDTADKGWPPCQAPPCKIEEDTLTDAAEVLDRRAENLVNLLQALQRLPRGQSVVDSAFHAASFPEKVSTLEVIELS